MLTNEKVLEIFRDYLSQDPAYEMVTTSRGYTVMAWDNYREAWYDVRLCPTPEALRDALMDAYKNYLEYGSTPDARDLTEAEERAVLAKLRAGKGAGYERWARGFNLKQMAQTLNYLSENGLLEYGALSEKTSAATARYNGLSAQIKAAEKRLAEIAVLRTHIINYSKTRDVYVAYRKAGYSKKFKAEHETELLLHQAAKKAFDKLGVKKLPTVKNLQAEYAKLLAEKKEAYGDYRKARDEMKELLTVKANVDRLMGYDEKQAEQEKEKGQGR